MRIDRKILAIAIGMGGMAGPALAQSPAPAPSTTPTLPAPIVNAPAPRTEGNQVPLGKPNPIPRETPTLPGTRGIDASGLAPLREVPPPVTPSTEASNLVPGTGTIRSNPAGLSVTPYLFHGYGYPGVAYMVPYGYRRSFYGGLGPRRDFARMRRMARLMNDLDHLIPGCPADPGRVDHLRQDIEALIYAREKPPEATLRKLAVDLARIVPVRKVPMLDTGQIARDIEVVVNSGSSAPEQIQDAIESVRRRLWHSGVLDRGILEIASDLRRIASGDIASTTPDGKPITYIP